MILSRRIFTGGCIYVIGEKGARYLTNCGIQDVSARGHRDLKFENPRHRMISNEYVIDKYLQGFDVWTELEIKRGLSPIPEIYVETTTAKTKKSLRRKLPDAVLAKDGFLYWVEVENAWKNKSRLAQLNSVAEQLLNIDNPAKSKYFGNDVSFQGMEFIFPNIHTFKSTLRAISDSRLSHDELINIDLVRVAISTGLRWSGEISRYSAWDLLQIKHHLENNRK